MSTELLKYQSDFLESFKFVKVEHYETPAQIAEKDFTQTYQSKMSTLLDFYFKLRNKVQVNVPELPLLPEDPKALDLVCGFLSATSLFGKRDLQHLLQTIPLPFRLDLCLKYIMKYEKEFNLEWDALEKKSSLPMDPNSAKQQFQEIYNFLKRSSENPFKKPIVEKLKENMANKKFPPEILKMIEEELSRFSELNESHPDYNIQRNFLELITALPFGVKSPDNFDISHARKLLDEDHYGLDEVKNRILEFIAVAKLKGSIKGKSLLLVGPPGVGKTSIGSSIARCLNRKFVRIALGGEHDVSVLKGHRKTYIGAYPGRIVQALKNSDTENPVILLDEVDKISSGIRGNLQDTLLEILDPVQNVKFTDHFLDTSIDLSNVLFICTANLTETIHPAVLDRMEVIHLSGYTKEEKKQILQRYLEPRALEASGLKEKYADKINITDQAIETLLVRYAREAGVRNLERLMKRICEKITLKFVKGDVSDITITPENLKDYVGLPIYSDQRLYKDIPPAGVILGLGYNSYGGSVLFIETMKSNFDAHLEQPKQKDQIVTNNTNGSRRGNIKLTGSLGDVMQESTQIAYSYAKYILSTFFKNSFLETNDVHIHFPDGASKKDGPSAGVAITSSLISLALNTPTADVVAMTGEISLTGKVLKIGGVKEKILAAKREGVKKVILPLDNKPDVDELKDYIKEALEFHFVDNYLQAMNILFPSLVKDKPAFIQAQKTLDTHLEL